MIILQFSSANSANQKTAGAGKTILASAIIEYLFDNLGSSNDAILYFLCDFSDASSLEIRTLVSSLLKQIITLSRPLPSTLHSDVEELLNNSQMRPSLQTLQHLFHTYIQRKNLTYLVIDGIDELEINDRQRVLNFFLETLSSQKEKFKVIISSRPEVDLPEACKEAELVSLQSVERPELETYIQDNLQTCEKLKVYSPDFIAEIQKALVSGADGM
jgi:Cdc6-like AAA superfamily ATPase